MGIAEARSTETRARRHSSDCEEAVDMGEVSWDEDKKRFLVSDELANEDHTD